MESFVFPFKVHLNLFLRVQLTIIQHCIDNGLAPNRRQAIIWTNADLLHWRIYAALWGDKLRKYHLNIKIYENMTRQDWYSCPVHHYWCQRLQMNYNLARTMCNNMFVHIYLFDWIINKYFINKQNSYKRKFCYKFWNFHRTGKLYFFMAEILDNYDPAKFNIVNQLPLCQCFV